MLDFKMSLRAKRQNRCESDTDGIVRMKGDSKMNNETKKIGVRQIAVTAMLSAVAFVLMYLEISIPIMPSFIKFDFSDLPALLGAFALGPVYGVIIELIKNVLHLVASQSLFIGELSNFILGAFFTFTAGLIYSKKKTKTRALIGGIAGSLVMGLVSIASNYYLVYPIYVTVFFGGDENICVGMYQAIAPFVDSLMECLLVFNLPFTVIKGLISVGVSMLIYKPLSPILKGNK